MSVKSLATHRPFPLKTFVDFGFTTHLDCPDPLPLGLGQCLETSQLLEFGARPSGGGTFGCCSVCGATLLDKEDTLCPQHSRGHCPDCGTQFAVDSKDKVKACQECGFKDFKLFDAQRLLKKAGKDTMKKKKKKKKGAQQTPEFEVPAGAADAADRDSEKGLQTGMYTIDVNGSIQDEQMLGSLDDTAEVDVGRGRASKGQRDSADYNRESGESI